MIDGKPMKVGDRIGKARIVSIDPGAVTLREANTTKVLQLYPGVEDPPGPRRRLYRVRARRKVQNEKRSFGLVVCGGYPRLRRQTRRPPAQVDDQIAAELRRASRGAQTGSGRWPGPGCVAAASAHGAAARGRLRPSTRVRPVSEQCAGGRRSSCPSFRVRATMLVNPEVAGMITVNLKDVTCARRSIRCASSTATSTASTARASSSSRGRADQDLQVNYLVGQRRGMQRRARAVGLACQTNRRPHAVEQAVP